jgi:aldehyde dehydrogenase (NAD+)/betaine-aldehyde dehydrogenase
MLIAGRGEPGRGDSFVVDDPATERELATVRSASTAQVDDALAAARLAFESAAWREPALRRDCLLALADLVERDRDVLAHTLVSEVGTPISLCETLQVNEPIAMLRDYAERTMSDRTRYLGRADGTPASDALVRYEPSGVVAAVAAYNYPLLFAALKVGAAVAAGCSVVLLPSYQTPLSTLHFGALCSEAGFPAGTVNVLAGTTAIARTLTSHPAVDKISFTGSTEIGRRILAQAAPGLTRSVLELGGKSPSILLPGVNLAEITTGVHARYLRNAGQGCSSPTRILVWQEQYDEFLQLTEAAVASINVGDPWDPNTVAGPLISAAHRARVEGYVERAIADGGRVVAGGGRPNLPHGWYMNPTVITDVSNRSEIARTELFGPVGLVFPYDSVDEALHLANDSEYGLSATIYGEPEVARALAPRLRVGTVMINGWIGRRDQSSGGFKSSGMGREAGEEGVREFLEAQYVAWPIP